MFKWFLSYVIKKHNLYFDEFKSNDSYVIVDLRKKISFSMILNSFFSLSFHWNASITTILFLIDAYFR